jgi:homoserine kinase
MGFSGAARVAGLLGAHVQRGRGVRDAQRDVLSAATELEGHADNVAASLLGGVVAVAAGRAVRVGLGRRLAVVAGSG